MKRHRNGGGGRSRPRADQGHDDADRSASGTAREHFLYGGDGGDFFRRSADRKADQKARQLCRQVYRTLTVALPGLGDAALQDLTVIAVDPAPDAGHLLVTVSPGSPDHGDDEQETVGNNGGRDGSSSGGLDLLARLSGAAGRLRAEVARDIVRKRAPELSFRVVPRGATELRGAPESHGEVMP